MKIANVSWAGVAGLPDRSLEIAQDGGEPPPLAIITGPPGSGKTRVLETIIAGKERIAAYGSRPHLDQVLGRGDAAKISIAWWLDDKERAYAGVRGDAAVQTTEALYVRSGAPELVPDPAIGAVLERYDHNPSHGKLDYIPADRGLPTNSTLVGDAVFDLRSKRLMAGPDKYGVLLKVAANTLLRRSDMGRITALEELFRKLCPHLKLGGVTGTGDIEAIRSDGTATRISRLSLSERDALALATSLILCGIHNSVVLFDTPELFVSDVEAARRLTILKETAPTNQWIVATNAPAVIAMAGGSGRVFELGAPQ